MEEIKKEETDLIKEENDLLKREYTLEEKIKILRTARRERIYPPIVILVIVVLLIIVLDKIGGYFGWELPDFIVWFFALGILTCCIQIVKGVNQYYTIEKFFKKQKGEINKK